MTPFQTLAAQGFTTICMNLQMCLSSGFVVAKFAFLLEPFVNVSKLFQWRRDTPSSSLNLQIDTDTISLCKGWGKQSTVYSGDKAPLLLLLLPQDRIKRANCFMDPRRFTVYFESQTDCSVVAKNVCLFSLRAEVQVMLEATETTITRAQVPEVEIIVLNPQDATGQGTMNRLCKCSPVENVWKHTGGID